MGCVTLRCVEAGRWAAGQIMPGEIGCAGGRRQELPGWSRLLGGPGAEIECEGKDVARPIEKIVCYREYIARHRKYVPLTGASIVGPGNEMGLRAGRRLLARERRQQLLPVRSGCEQ